MSASGKAPRNGELWSEDEIRAEEERERKRERHRASYEGSSSPDLIIIDEEWSDETVDDAGAAAAPISDKIDEDEEWPDETVDDDAGAAAGAAAAPISDIDYWTKRTAEMTDLMETQEKEREQVQAQIDDLQEVLRGLDKQIEETTRGRNAIESLKRVRVFKPEEGKDYLTRLPSDLKYILKKYLTGLDIARLSRVDKSWNKDIHNRHDEKRIEQEKLRWTKPLQKIETSGSAGEAKENFLWYGNTPVFVDGQCQIKYTWSGNDVTTQLSRRHNVQNDKFYGGKTHIYQWACAHGRYIYYAKWGDANVKRVKLGNPHDDVEKCDDIVPMGGYIYFADNGIIRRFNPLDDPSNSPMAAHDAVTRAKSISEIKKFAMSAEYVVIAKNKRVEVYDRTTQEEVYRFGITNKVQFLAMAGSTICIQYGKIINLHKVSGEVKRVYPLEKLRLTNPLGYTDGSFLFDLYDSQTPKFKLFRMAQYAADDKVIDEDMHHIISKQYSEFGTFGIFIEPVYPASGFNYLYVSRPG